MKEYRVMIECENTRVVGIVVFAKDREDAIKFVKRNHRMRFWSKEYKRVKSAKEINKIKAVNKKIALLAEACKQRAPDMWQPWPADETQ